MSKLQNAYLYSRVSNVDAAKHGEGLRRQQEKAKDWLKNYPNYKLSDKVFIDAGKSGYHGANLDPQAGLGSFLDACERGIVSPGSLLCVELVDRLGRLPPRQAKNLFNKILDYGISVAIVKWNLIVDAFSNNDDLSSDLLLTVGFHLAYMESKQKSERIRATHAIRRQVALSGGKKRTAVAPAWLRLSDDRSTFTVVKSRAKLIQKIFQLKLGGKGANIIAREFNEQGIPTFSGKPKWSKTTINTYLRTPSVLGHFQAHTVSMVNGKRIYTKCGDVNTDYYPSIIDESTFYQVQSTFKNNNAGRLGNFQNLFRGMTKCDLCGGTMSWTRSPSSTGIPNFYLRCTNVYLKKLCTKPSVKYEAFEGRFIDALLNGEIFKDSFESELAEKSKQAKADLHILQQQKNNIQEAITLASPEAITELVPLLDQLHLQINATKQFLFESQQQINNSPIQEINSLLRTFDTKDQTQREQLNLLLKRTIATIKPRRDSFTIDFKNSEKSSKINMIQC